MATDVTPLLRAHGIAPSAQRVAVARFVLATDTHPSADEVWKRVRQKLPQISRATVYNTLNLFAERGLLRAMALAEGRTVFDARKEPHHHFVDEETGRIHDVPWADVPVPKTVSLPGYDVREFQVVMRGRRRRRKR